MPISSLNRTLIAGGLAVLLASPLAAFETLARAAMVVDHATGTVLLSKNASEALPPASMSKLMTLVMLFEAVRDGRVSLDTKFKVSREASQKGGSKMFLRDGERVSVDDLIQGIIVQSGNDACITVAENLAGSEAEFARLMTRRGQRIGLKDSTFANATGWPHPMQRMSARDLVFLARYIQDEFPEFYPYFTQKSFTWDNITQDNRNPLLKAGIGADGLKTGHTEEAGYGLVASAKQGDRRVTMMITGLQSSGARSREAERIMAWAFRQFTVETVATAGEPVAQAEVWMGRSDTVALTPGEDVTALLPYDGEDAMTLSLRYHAPLIAPLAKGDEVGQLVVQVEGQPERAVPLLAAQDVRKGGMVKRIFTTAQSLTGMGS